MVDNYDGPEQCKFCKTYFDATGNLRSPIKAGNSIIDRRHCTITGKLVMEDDGCDMLTLSKFVWCPERSQWMHRMVCTNRYLKKAADECKKCSTGWDLIQVVRKVGTQLRKRVNSKRRTLIIKK